MRAWGIGSLTIVSQLEAQDIKKSNVEKSEGRWKFVKGGTQHKGQTIRIVTNKGQ